MRKTQKKKGGYTTPAPTLDLMASLRGDLLNVLCKRKLTYVNPLFQKLVGQWSETVYSILAAIGTGFN